MLIREILLKIKQLANENGLSEPFIVGGLPRDKMLGRTRMIDDVDLTTGDESIHKLAVLCANYFRVHPVQFPDGHFQLFIENLKYDFSSNFKSPSIDFFLDRAGIKDPTPMQKELLSRDFTCNTLILPLNLRKIKDPTGLSINDIKNKIIRTPLPPKVTLRDDPNRSIRAIYLAAKLGFKVEYDIVKWVLKNQNTIHREVKPGFSKKKLAKAARYDMNKTISLISAMDLWSVIGIPNVLMEEAGIRGLL
jgi:tRNA nucleotidyltransferase (CCA-adding enzyme)